MGGFTEGGQFDFLIELAYKHDAHVEVMVVDGWKYSERVEILHIDPCCRFRLPTPQGVYIEVQGPQWISADFTHLL